MQNYLLGATGIIFLSVIVTLVMPEGKLNKTVTFAMRMICILVLIQPLTGIFSLPSTQPAENFTDYEFVCEQYSKHQSAQLEKLILERFGIDSDCLVEVEAEDGNFKVTSAEVAVDKKDCALIENIYEYLRELDYKIVTVYAESS